MGLKCRLFGHAYGTPEVERSRKEEGDEVVVTIRNVKRCERCGDEKMVNQTKEVTSVRDPEEVGLATETGASDPSDGTDTEPGAPEAGSPTAQVDDESPVTPADPDPTAAADPPADDDPVDATVGPDAGSVADAEPVADAEVADTPGDPVADAVSDPAAAGDDTGAAITPGESAGTDDGAEAADDRDGDAVDEDSPPAAGTEAPEAPTVEAAEEPTAAEPVEDADDGWATGSDDWDDVDPDPDADDAVILDAEETERDEVQWPEESDADPESPADVDDPTADTAAPEEEDGDDAEIIDPEGADAGSPGGSTGEWPEHEGAAGGWPEHDTEDEGYSATPNGDVDADFGGGGLTPEVNGGAPDDPAEVDGITVGGADGAAAERARTGGDGDAAEADADTGQGFVRAGDSTAESEVPADRIEFYCPNCGHARTAGRSSLRAGDICPECKQGYIAERER